MTQARFDLDDYAARVLDVVKGTYGLKNRNEALHALIREHGTQYANPKPSQEVLNDLDRVITEHKRKYGKQHMTDEELNELLGA